MLRHADVTTVGRHPEVFSASEGGVVIEDLEPDQLTMMRMMLLAMDPPGHLQYRRPLAPTFTARSIATLEEQIRAVCRRIMGEVGGEVDFVHDVCAFLPSQIIGELMGIPENDWPRIHQWAERLTGFQDADLDSDDDPGVSMAMYAIEMAGRRRAEPEQRDDLAGLILSIRFGDEPMTDIDFGSFFVQLVTAGNDTTRTMLSSGLHALLQHPDQLAMLRADSSLLHGAVEEILRWANPLHYFRRTALQDTELNGTRIAAGQKVAMVYTSANRDSDVFADPDRFDITRHPNPHLSFGVGEHFCLGAQLARLEGRIFFEELLSAFPVIEQVGEPVRMRSNLNNALKRLPVRLGA
ncbi:MAG: cholest-4-en-3-one 26-monooxygenase [Actinomycetota bacterium]|nr:cholest-4-en-3-one 26-monooxygenase [Actinomycetota bacterium]